MQKIVIKLGVAAFEAVMDELSIDGNWKAV
jgi:hypothetical protein